VTTLKSLWCRMLHGRRPFFSRQSKTAYYRRSIMFAGGRTARCRTCLRKIAVSWAVKV
jgi:hypothetical protein